MNRKQLSERDICTKFITPAIDKAGWDIKSQVREEVSFTDGKIYVRGYLDKNGNPVEDRIYNRTDFDKNLVVDERRRLIGQKITEFLKGTDRFSKTIVFCVDIEHAEGIRTELVNANSDLARANSKYIMRITGDNDEGITGDELLN